MKMGVSFFWTAAEAGDMSRHANAHALEEHYSRETGTSRLPAVEARSALAPLPTSAVNTR